jgi:hypothetical protein
MQWTILCTINIVYNGDRAISSHFCRTQVLFLDDKCYFLIMWMSRKYKQCLLFLTSFVFLSTMMSYFTLQITK